MRGIGGCRARLTNDVEAALGHLRFLALYLLSGIVGGLAHAISDLDSVKPLIGASGAMAGVVGAHVLLRPNARIRMLALGIVPFRMRAIWIVSIWLIFQVASVLVPQAEGKISYWSHLGGFAAGILALLVLRPRGVPLLGRCR